MKLFLMVGALFGVLLESSAQINFGDLFFNVPDVLEDEVTTENVNLALDGIVSSYGNDSIHISDEVWEALQDAPNMEAFLSLLGLPDTPEEEEEEQNVTQLLRSSQQDVYMNNPVEAFCTPEMQTVDLGLSTLNDVHNYPSCVRVKRCGGCCKQKSCLPVATRSVLVKVVQLYTQQNAAIHERHSLKPKRKVRGKRASTNMMWVPVEEHTRCRCMCKVNESDCNLKVHNFDEYSCSCVCRNRDDKKKCNARLSHHWDEHTCSCKCKRKIDCSSGFEIDHNTCLCKRKEEKVDIKYNDIFLRRTRAKTRNTRREAVAVPV